MQWEWLESTEGDADEASREEEVEDLVSDILGAADEQPSFACIAKFC